MSSSGTYSGGSDRHGTLEPAQTRALWRHVESLEGAAGDHTTTRRKGTTSLRVARGTRVREFIVDGGAAVGPFAAFLDQFRG